MKQLNGSKNILQLPKEVYKSCCFGHSNPAIRVFQEQEVVNIKLSDYGISRQSFHEGVLGVEGTPGYQAPEVRPGIVYDEKVQIIIVCSSVFH